MKKIGLDVGSTTIKCVVVNENNEIIYSDYRRHMSKISEMSCSLMAKIAKEFPGECMKVTLSGSAGMGMAQELKIPFVQEVYATRVAVKSLAPKTDVVIELGGEDAKILFLSNGLEVRMNGSCAGGTGAFIDQMATLMKVKSEDVDELAKSHEKIYTIASRCGVFAKSDIQPLINQGARKEDIAASIFDAVVNQTVGGLAQGREIKGRVTYLGGPLTFFPQLRKSFDKTLNTEGYCPENSLYFVALGAAFSNEGQAYHLEELSKVLNYYSSREGYISCNPLFESQEDYHQFVSDHKADSEHVGTIESPKSEMYLGIDAGSTTVKAVLCDENGMILDQMYRKNSGNPVPIVKEYLESVYKRFPGIKIKASAATGYGEDIIKNAFHVDFGVVETIAHYTAAKKFKPDVDFIIDIGGQDIKCFKIHNGAIDNIFLNEACSSGCGSFLQTFAEALGYEMNEFAKLGLLGDRPADLGSRCTVFMNSAVKQAQKDGAKVENISAGLSISVVKNALYKVIRCASADQLGQNIVVQGGTFLNDAVLRAFEQEIGRKVIRPSIAGVMGAYGAALYAKELLDRRKIDGLPLKTGGILDEEKLKAFQHKVRTTLCQGCSNHCQLTINIFSEGDKYIAGNRCEKPLANGSHFKEYNLFKYKTQLLEKYRKNERQPGKLTIGIPMVLNMYELLPFWYTLLKELGFNVVVSPPTTRELYLKGQMTIPSDTVCFPAKLVHGHIEELFEEKVDATFYPCMTYNIDEDMGDNHFNCPVVAYYPEVIKDNVSELKKIKYISDFVGIHEKRQFPKHFSRIMSEHFKTEFTARQVRKAFVKAMKEYERHMADMRQEADRYLQIAKAQGIPVIALCGRPYHLDPEVNHGIDELICELGAMVVTEDSISSREKRFKTRVLNQWTYHARLYAAAKFISENEDPDLSIHLVQLVSFGCGVDAVTTDETRTIIENGGGIYTQVKIDEITNMGAARIRLRSLFAACHIETRK